MFITTKYSGYNRHGEQSAAGRFLILMQPSWETKKFNEHTDFCRTCGTHKDNHPDTSNPVPDCDVHGIVARLKKLDELAMSGDRAAYDAYKDEMGKFWESNNHDRHVSGCAQCDAYKLYTSLCRDFKPAAVKYPLRAIVRYVRMRQCGQFMMGTARVGKHNLVLSGSYGSDGLPKSVPDEVYEMGVDLPDELREQWNNGGGWNGAGNEAPAMRKWALDMFPTKR